jgi:D-glycero-alpha-D-manno-heptose-7-phosphate kinase
MIITRTPYRISLFGGGSDFPIWYKNNDGLVVSFSINKYCYIFCRELPPFFDYNYRLTYSKVETVFEIDDIKHPAFREAIRHYTNQNLRLDIQHHGDLPARSGIGSSSAFAVGLIHALHIFRDQKVNLNYLANEAINLEQYLIGDNVGSQDQIACSFGGINTINFSPKDAWIVNSINLHEERISEIEDRCFLVYSQISRSSSKITEGLLEEFEKKNDLLFKSVKIASQGLEVIKSNSNYDEIGDLLNEGWRLKKASNPASVNSAIDKFINSGITAGALGAKVLGAGGGGFILFWLKRGEKDRFRKDFTLGKEVQFKIEMKGTVATKF